MTGEWISVSDDMPQLDRDYDHISVEVEVLLMGGAIKKAFYADNHERWYIVGGFHAIPDGKVVAWRSI